MDRNNLVSVDQHFCSFGPDFNWGAKFPLLERIENDFN